MGLRLLRWFWDSATSPEFALAGSRDTLFARAEKTTIVATQPMAQVYIPSWGIKDPDDIRTKNYDFVKVLFDAGSPTIDDFNVEVTGAVDDAGAASADAGDGALVISAVAWDATLRRVSFRWEGGTLGWKYLITARIASGAVFSADQSAWVTIANK